MQVTGDDLAGIMENIWIAILGMSIENVGDREVSADELISGCVHITGPWSGALLIECSPIAAKSVGVAMFAMDLAEVGDSEMRDAIGELANIAGGNFKSLLPMGCQLSLPTVVDGSQYKLIISNSSLVCQRSFDSEGQYVAIKIFERGMKTDSKASNENQRVYAAEEQ